MSVHRSRQRPAAWPRTRCRLTRRRRRRRCSEIALQTAIRRPFRLQIIAQACSESFEWTINTFLPWDLNLTDTMNENRICLAAAARDSTAGIWKAFDRIGVDVTVLIAITAGKLPISFHLAFLDRSRPRSRHVRAGRTTIFAWEQPCWRASYLEEGSSRVSVWVVRVGHLRGSFTWAIFVGHSCESCIFVRRFTLIARRLGYNYSS